MEVSVLKTLKICIGSACHLKGSYDVIEILQSLIKEYELEDKLELKAAFCLGHCTEAVSVERWDGQCLSFSKDNTKAEFEKNIMPLL
jgi:NADH:ubiquinone oxidoreductase 24 kD subunit